MKPGDKPAPILSGVILGFLLQPLAILFGFWFTSHVLVSPTSSMPGLSIAFAMVGYFGAFQPVVIVPASLLFFAIGKRGVVEGLLLAGCVVAIGNLIAWFLVFGPALLPHN